MQSIDPVHFGYRTVYRLAWRQYYDRNILLHLSCYGHCFVNLGFDWFPNLKKIKMFKILRSKTPLFTHYKRPMIFIFVELSYPEFSVLVDGSFIDGSN